MARICNNYNGNRFAAGSDEDPYSILMPSTNSASTNSSGEENKKSNIISNSSSNTSSRESIPDYNNRYYQQKPPKLPPREFNKAKKIKSRFGLRSLVKSNSNGKLNQLQSSDCDVKNYENPYYCGMQARVPDFGVKLNGKKGASDMIARENALLPSAATVSSATAANSSNGTSLSHFQLKQSDKCSPETGDMKKSQSNGYLNSLFNQSSNLFGGKKVRDRSEKKTHHVTQSGFYYYTSLDSSGFFGAHDSDIYNCSRPSALYGRANFAPQTQLNDFRKRTANSTLPLYEFSTHRYPSDWR